MPSNVGADSMIIMILHLVWASLPKTKALGLAKKARLGFKRR